MLGHMTSDLCTSLGDRTTGLGIKLDYMTTGPLGHMTSDLCMRLGDMTTGLGTRPGHMTTPLCLCVGMGAGDAGVCTCATVPGRGQCLLPGRDQPAHHLRHL